MDESVATAAARGDHRLPGPTRLPARDRAFAGLLAEASIHDLDGGSVHADEIGLLAQIMP